MGQMSLRHRMKVDACHIDQTKCCIRRVCACICVLIQLLECSRCLCMYHGCLTYADGALLFIRRRARQQGACSTHVNGSAALLSEQAGIQAHRHAQRGQAVPLD